MVDFVKSATITTSQYAKSSNPVISSTAKHNLALLAATLVGDCSQDYCTSSQCCLQPVNPNDCEPVPVSSCCLFDCGVCNCCGCSDTACCPPAPPGWPQRCGNDQVLECAAIVAFYEGFPVVCSSGNVAPAFEALCGSLEAIPG